MPSERVLQVTCWLMWLLLLKIAGDCEQTYQPDVDGSAGVFATTLLLFWGTAAAMSANVSIGACTLKVKVCQKLPDEVHA